MTNEQPQMPVVKDHDGEYLAVHSMARTIQAEGPFAGWTAIFIRMGYCNLQCPMCDTEYSGNVEEDVWYKELVVRVMRLAKPGDIVVITGGEPLRQNLLPLVRELADRHLQVQIETNGTICVSPVTIGQLTRYGVYFVCSPKTARLHPELVKVINCYKYVVEHGNVDPVDGLPVTALQNPVGKGKRVARPPKFFQGPVYIQAMDSHDGNNELHRKQALSSVMDFPGHRILGVQFHKEFGIY